MKIALFGAGKMGRAVEKITDEITLRIDSKTEEIDLSEIDVCIDFSHPNCALKHIQIASEYGVPIVSGTTGFDLSLARPYSLKIGIVHAPNFSIGVLRFMKTAEELQNRLPEYLCRIHEIHHKEKIDAPSGTALQLGEKLHTSAITFERSATHFGIHEVHFTSGSDTISLRHESHGRESYALGAYEAAKWIIGKKGLFKFEDIYEQMQPGTTLSR